MCSTRSMVATGVSLGAPRRAPSRGATRVHARPRKAGRSDNRERRETLLHHRRGERNGLTFRRNAQAEEQAGAPLAPCITLTDNALAHLTQLKGQKAAPSDSERNKLLLRIGVKQGGCSGMSYFMDFETPDQVVDDDAVMELEGDMKLVCDPKSLLYLFGMELDYSNELIGGGFKFSNPNADSTCGCGKSFSV